MKVTAIVLAAVLPISALAGTITQAVRTVEATSKDEFGYPFNGMVAGILAAKLEPAILDNTVLFEYLMPGLSCESVKVAGDEFSWREKGAALKAEFKQAAATFSVTDVYAISTIHLGDYDFDNAAFPYQGGIIQFAQRYLEGKAQGRASSSTNGGGSLNPAAGTTNGLSILARGKSPSCDLYVKNAGGAEPRVKVVGAPYLLSAMIPIEKDAARDLVAHYPKRDFVLLSQFKISGSQLSRDGQTVFLKSEDFKYFLCDGANPPMDWTGGYSHSGEIRCTKIIMPIVFGPLNKPYPYVLPELPTWAGVGGSSGSSAFGTSSSGNNSGGGTTKSVTVNSNDIVKGVGSFFGKIKDAVTADKKANSSNSTDAPATDSK